MDPFFVGAEAFVKVLSREFPSEDALYEQAITMLHVAATLSPDSTKEKFRAFIDPHKQAICEQNEIEPLLAYDISDKGLGAFETSIQRLKDVWQSPSTSNRQRATVILYLQRLIQVLYM